MQDNDEVEDEANIQLIIASSICRSWLNHATSAEPRSTISGVLDFIAKLETLIRTAKCKDERPAKRWTRAIINYYAGYGVQFVQ
jgi:hypothetical protein